MDKIKAALRIVGTLLGIILVIILVLGLIPVSADGLGPSPDPSSTYAEAIQRFEAVQQEERDIVREAVHSILLTHGDATDKVFVFVHGITNSPRQWEELGTSLHVRGHNVLIMRMPHHGLLSGEINELAVLQAEELRAYADRVIDIAAGLGDEITVIGLSGGGTVTSWIAQHRPEVDRILALSPFFGIPQVPPAVNTFLFNLVSRIPNINLVDPTEPERDWVYRGEATRGVVAFLKLGKELFQSAQTAPPTVTNLNVVTTAVDDTASNVITGNLIELWTDSGADISTFEFTESVDIPHNSVDPATDPAKKALVYAKILEMLGEEPLQ